MKTENETQICVDAAEYYIQVGNYCILNKYYIPVHLAKAFQQN